MLSVLTTEKEGGRRLQEGCFERDGLFITLTVVMISQVQAYVETIQLYTLKMCRVFFFCIQIRAQGSF